MKNNIKGDKQDFSAWMMFAEDDLLSAEVLLKEKIFNQVCFHSQQAVEKILKAFLKFKKIIPPKIHSLLELLEMCKKKDSSFNTLQEGCEYLSRFYLPVRYPDTLPGTLPEGLPDFEESEKALKFAKEILLFVKTKLDVK